jgi:hypothetical protein
MLKFRRPRETHKLGGQLFAEVGRVVPASAMTLSRYATTARRNLQRIA